MLLFSLLFLFFTNFNSFAQSITWNTEVGCAEYGGTGGEGNYVYQEVITGGRCLREAENSQTIFTLTNSNATWLSTVWNVAGGTISSQTTTSCTVNWGVVGPGSISAVVTTTTGIINIPSICVEKIIRPTANIQILPNAVNEYNVNACSKQDILFSNLSTANGSSPLVSYLWSFGDGTFSTEFEPTHRYVVASTTTFLVRLIVTNACNVPSIAENIQITVSSDLPVPIDCASIVCEGQTAKYTVPSTLSCTNFDWTVTGGTIVQTPPYSNSIDVIWNNLAATENFGFVTFNPSACASPCTSPTTIKIPVIKSTTDIVGETQICTNKQYIYKLPQWPTTDFQFSITPYGVADLSYNDQRNEVILTTNASSSGQLVLKVVYVNTLLKCGGKSQLVINILLPNSIFGTKKVCKGSFPSYTLANGGVATWTLTKPSGGILNLYNLATFSTTFTEVGNYNLSAFSPNFCAIEDIVISVSDLPAVPTASLLLGQGQTITDPMCPQVPVTFSYNNTNPNTIIGWSITNGTITSANYGNSITATFNNTPPPYSISVWQENIADPYCRSALVTKTIYGPDLSFLISGNTPICSSTSGTYSVPYTQAESYQWTVVPATAGSVSAGNGTPNATVQWNLVTATTPATVRLTYIKCGLTFIKNFSVSIIPTFNVQINPLASSGYCRGTAAVNPTLVNPPTTYTSITWDFGDGSPLQTGLTPSYTYPVTSVVGAAANNYTISVKIVGANGCITAAIATTNVLVNPNPVCSITPGGTYAVCDTPAPNWTTVNLVLTRTVQTGVTYQWFKNNVAIAGATAVTYLVTDYGLYYCKATITATGCSINTNVTDVIAKCADLPPCTISGNPIVTLTKVAPPTTQNCNFTQTVTATYRTAGAIASSILWDNTAGTLVSSGAPVISGANTSITRVYSFPDPGLYDIFFTVSYPSTTGVPCKVTKKLTPSIIVPFKTDLRYTVTCGSPSGLYNVNLVDNSNFYPSTLPTSWKFERINNVGGAVTLLSTQTTQAAPHTFAIANLAPGNYSFKLTLIRAGYNNCAFTTGQVILPALPNPTITVTPACGAACTNVCVDTNIKFAITNPQPDDTYLWAFGDDSFNAAQNPDKEYVNGGSYTPTLTVTNKYGCSKIFTLSPILIKANGQLGGISANPTNACAGGSIPLTYAPLSGATPSTSYQWYNNQTLIAGATTNPYSVSQTGLYWVKVTNANGCKKDINGIGVSFRPRPTVFVSGPNSICADTAFELVGNVGAIPGATYTWTLNGIATGTGAVLSLGTGLAAGTWDFALAVTIPYTGTGLTCNPAVVHKIVTVLAIPDAPVISILSTTCSPKYLVQLQATSTQPGIFTWSDGFTGAIHTVTEGGAIQVRITNAGGCSNTFNFYVPKNPERFLWVVPQGCYTFCNKLNDPYLVGPKVLNSLNWAWNNNAPGTLAFGSVPNNPLLTSGNYSLTLQNATCIKTSRSFNLQVVTGCIDCGVNPTILSVATLPETGFCSYNIIVHLDNNTGSDLPISITSNAGFITPNTVIVPNGGADFTIILVPNNLLGSTANFYFENTNKNGIKCRSTLGQVLPACNTLKMAGSNLKEVILIIEPNPSKGEVTIDFDYVQTTATNQFLTIEIYDLTGRKLNSFESREMKGIWNLNVQDFAAGTYVVVLKENGVILNQKKLIKN